MKVLIINDHKDGGGAESVVAMQYQLLKEAISVDILYGDELSPEINIFSYIYSYKVKKAVVNKLKEANYDIVHLHNFYHILSPSVLQALRQAKKTNHRLKVIYTAHDYHLVCPNSGYYYLKNKSIVNFQINDKWPWMFINNIDKRSIIHNLLKKAQWFNAYVIHDYKRVIDVITAPSFFLKQVILEHFNADVRMIRNPSVPINNNAGVFDKTADNKLQLVFFGRLSIEKGLNNFIKLLSQINDIPYHLSVIGDGPEYHELTKLVAQYRLTDKIKFIGKMVRSDLLSSLKKYDLFVLPSVWYENAPMSILEAAQAGLMIATPDHGGMTEMVEAVGGGYHFNYADPGKLKSCLIDAQRVKHQKPQSHINDFAAFLPETFCSKMIDLYKEVLSNQSQTHE